MTNKMSNSKMSNSKMSNSNKNILSTINKMNNIKGNDTLLKLFCCLTIVVLICILIGNYAFKNGLLTCDHYVFNTYLYIILGLLLMFIVVLINDQTGIFNSLMILLFSGSVMQSIIIIIIILGIMAGLTYALRKVNPTNILASNSIWLILIVLIGITLIPIMWLGRLTDVVGLAGILTVIITIVVGLLGYYLGDKIVTFNWDYYLSIALFGLIIVMIIGPFFLTTVEQSNNFYYALAICSLIIFILLLLSNHKNLKKNSEKCIDGKVVPNYPVESYGLIIKIVNIFSDLIRILSNKKLR